jgi:hypothetical protein
MYQEVIPLETFCDIEVTSLLFRLFVLDNTSRPGKFLS